MLRALSKFISTETKSRYLHKYLSGEGNKYAKLQISIAKREIEILNVEYLEKNTTSLGKKKSPILRYKNILSISCKLNIEKKNPHYDRAINK